MDAVLQLSSTVGIEAACDALGVARATFYRRRPLLGPPMSVMLPAPVRRPVSARALSSDERESVRAVLNSERFQDCSPAAIHATLLDEGQYLCSTRTMYRVLEEDDATRERRDQLVHPQYQKPELLARPFRLYPGQPSLLPYIFPVVQRRAPTFWNRDDVSSCGPSRCCVRGPRKPPACSGCRLSRPSRTLRPTTAYAPSTSRGGLDQQTTEISRRHSLNTQRSVSSSLTRAGRYRDSVASISGIPGTSKVGLQR